MTDITTKLRSGNYGILVQDLNFEAADEIDRLRAEVAGMKDEISSLWGLVRDGATQYEALREDSNYTAHFVVDLRAILAQPTCDYGDLLMVARDAAQDADRYRWLLNCASREEWRQWGTYDSYDEVERAIDEAMAARAALAPAAEVSGG